MASGRDKLKHSRNTEALSRKENYQCVIKCCVSNFLLCVFQDKKCFFAGLIEIQMIKSVYKTKVRHKLDLEMCLEKSQFLYFEDCKKQRM